MFRVVSRFSRYISCYIVESRLPLGQCRAIAAKNFPSPEHCCCCELSNYSANVLNYSVLTFEDLFFLKINKSYRTVYKKTVILLLFLNVDLSFLFSPNIRNFKNVSLKTLFRDHFPWVWAGNLHDTSNHFNDRQYQAQFKKYCCKIVHY